MNLTLKRTAKLEAGIFGKLLLDGQFLLFTLEHAYLMNGEFTPKLPNGEYACVLGNHRLHNMAQDFQTYEVTNVPGHSGILFHWGNTNKDSDGCILVGKTNTANAAITHSKDAFELFMQTLNNQPEFTLVVS